MNRKRILLAVLLGVLAISLFYAFFSTPRLEKASPRGPERKASSTGPKAVNVADGEQQRIKFDFLADDTAQFPGARRDIFKYVRRQPVRTEPVTRSEPPPPPVAKPAVVRQEEQEDTDDTAAKPRSTFTYLGFLERNGEKIVFLSSSGKLFLAKRGEAFGVNQEFIVEDIFGNFLDVRPAGGGRVMSVPLIDQAKLRSLVSAPAQREPRPEVTIPEPKPRRPRGAKETRQAGESNSQELPSEVESEENQQVESSAAGDVIEGEANGKNQ